MPYLDLTRTLRQFFYLISASPPISMTDAYSQISEISWNVHQQKIIWKCYWPLLTIVDHCWPLLTRSDPYWTLRYPMRESLSDLVPGTYIKSSLLENVTLNLNLTGQLACLLSRNYSVKNQGHQDSRQHIRLAVQRFESLWVENLAHFKCLHPKDLTWLLVFTGGTL